MLSQMPFSAISWAVASSISMPCSIHFTPAAMDRWIAAGVKACVATYVPQFSAASTAARSSASVKVVTSIGLKGDDTPPPAVNLIWEAPCMSCSRVRRRTSSGLSATMAPPSCSMRVSMPPIVRGRSVSWRKSPCPLVTVITAPDG